jgi:hypothetical protein
MQKRATAFTRTVERAMENVGDPQRLADLLGVGVADLDRWTLGRELPPHDVFLRALDLAFRATLPLASQLPQLAPDSRSREPD